MKLLFIAVSFTFILSGFCLSATYYSQFDHPEADDTGPGTEERPWKYCPNMPGWSGAVLLQAGDTVLFRNASAWEISDGDSIIQTTGGVTYDGRSWGPGQRATLRAMGDLYCTVINFMQDNADQPTVVRGFDVDANNRVTSGVGFNWPHAERLLVGAVKRIEDCVVHDVYSRESLNQFEYGISVGGGLEKWVKNVEVLNCTVFNISRTGISICPGNDLPGNRVENVVVRGCEVYNTGTDPSGAGAGYGMGIKNHAVNVVLEYNDIHNTAISGILVTTHPVQDYRGPENAVIRHNIIQNCGQCGIFVQQRGDKSVAIYGNLILNNFCEGIRLALSLSDRLEMRIFNNTFYHNYELDWSQELRIETNHAAIDVLEIKNNIFQAASTTRCFVDDDSDATAHCNNNYNREGGGILVISSDRQYTDNDVRSWEPSAQTDDPLFNDADSPPDGFTGVYGIDLRPDAEGFNISMYSPMKDRGMTLENSFKSSINSIMRPSGSQWDIGAYEYKDENGDYLRLNRDRFQSGDRFHLQKRAVNAEPYFVQVCDFVILDVYGLYFFWPEWTSGIDCVFKSLAPDSNEDLDVLDFTWPQSAGTGNEIWLYSGLIDPVTLALFGESASVMFSY